MVIKWGSFWLEEEAFELVWDPRNNLGSGGVLPRWGLLRAQERMAKLGSSGGRGSL